MNYRFLKQILAILIICLNQGFSIAADNEGSTGSVFVGRKACVSCHAEENDKWTGSHHDLAMQQANEQTVLGNFNQQKFTRFDLETLFFREGDHYMVRTDGPDGKLRDYRIKYAFGFYPLQQYLIEFPGGRLQTLDIAWDSRPKEQGGQRWMHLHPDEKISHNDVLHWTGPNLNWNYMCADCHSTNLQKNYDAKTGSYHTTWSEIDVSCEACHGPGSEHISWTKLKPSERQSDKNKGLNVSFHERDGISWNINSATGVPQRSQINTLHTEVQVCAQCHSRRSQVAQPTAGDAFMDAYIPAVLTEGLYHPDGQLQDEVYVYGSFLQSKMYQKGVTCSDCHDPHSNELKLPGDKVCSQCHLSEKYASTEHHFHPSNSAGARCVECHMPATTYMEVDDRHDHSFRIPRPDLSVTMGTPNACTNCHDIKTAKWATKKMKKWYGDKFSSYQHFAATLNAARQQEAGISPSLQSLAVDLAQPNIARATALQELQAYPGQQTMAVIQQNLNDPDPILRRSAVAALSQFDLRMQALMAFPMLSDPVRAVRLEAISLLARIPPGQLTGDQKKDFQKAVDEYIEVQQFNAERPEAMVNLGGFYNALGDQEKALRAFKRALQLQPQFVPAYIYLGQLFTSQGQEQKAEKLIRTGIKQVPESADLAEALGLSLVRQKKNDEALNWLARAAQMDQDNIHYAYVYGVALNSTGKNQQAIHHLEKVHQRFPANTDILYALVTFNRDAGNNAEALKYLAELEKLMPANQQLQQLRQDLSAK